MKEELTISEQLKHKRQSLGLSLSEVARRAGTSAATISRYENNWTRFEVYTLRKLATALDCDLKLSLQAKRGRDASVSSNSDIISQLGRLFWDHKLTKSDLTNYSVWVVERVLEYGKLDDVDILRKTMGRKAFLNAVAAAGRLSPHTRNFWHQILNMENIKCTKKYSRNTAWSC